MKSKKTGRLRFLLLGLSALVLLCLTAVALLAWDNTRLPERSIVTDKLSQLEKARLIEAQHLRQSVGDDVLPGWGQAVIPLILYNEEYAFLTGVSAPPPDGWKTVRLGQQHGTSWEIVPEDDFQGKPYYRQALQSGVTPQAFTVRIGEDYAASLVTFEYYPMMLRSQLQDGLPDIIKPIFPFRLYTNLLVDSSDQFVSLILHEAAHAYQGIAAPQRLVDGEQANVDLENAYPWEDASLREDWQSELDTLALALRAKTDEEARALALEFLQIRHSRRQTAGLSADLIDFERQREWVEGIGRYAEISVYRWAYETTDYSPAQEILEDPGFHRYERFEKRWVREIDQMKRMARDEGEGRFYYTGMAQAVLLDRLAPGWKSHLFEPGVWLEDLLEQALSTASGSK